MSTRTTTTTRPIGTRWAASACASAERARGGAIAGSLRIAALAALSFAGAASAQPDTLTLSDAEKAALTDRNTEASVASARAGPGPDAGRSGIARGIHGAFGAEIGSHGTHGTYGTAAIPLGDRGGATVSFESSRFGGPR